MPKMKSHRGAKKRFKVTSTGKIRRRRAFANHLLENKTSKRKRRLKSPTVVASADVKNVRRMLGE
ncbi:MAG TPA: 50S ribosomal protein L35 [Actinomycetota bacterium]|nr:50S ribosomal protein L35 [Actinomycetota bacterium]